MELTYNDIKKRDVINVVDGKCFGRVNNLSLSFPQGVLTGIFVPVRKNRGFFWFLDKSSFFIGVDKIVKIGGDVILVDVKCGENCVQNTTVGKREQSVKSINSAPPPCPPNQPCPPPPCPPAHCPPPCPTSCVPPCPPPCPPQNSCGLPCGGDTINLSDIFDKNGRIDLDDY